MKYRHNLKNHPGKSIVVEIDGRYTHIKYTYEKPYGIVMKCPKNVSVKTVDRLYDENEAKLKELEEKGRKNGMDLVKLNDKNEFCTHNRCIALVPWDEPNYKLEENRDKVNIMYPKDVALNDLELQMRLKQVIDIQLKIEAMTYLPQRTARIAAEMGISYGKVTVRNNKSNWGSCSSTGNISLNIQLMRLPDRLIDMVIRHELCHRKHMDHSKAFYAELNKHCGGHLAELEAELNQWHTCIYVSSYDRPE